LYQTPTVECAWNPDRSKSEPPVSTSAPKPSQGKLISARVALAAAKQGTLTALELNHGSLTKSAREAILAAALRTLG
jgi:hypothetical protein